ncbi:hypothetical protein C8D87_108164 [Lentzea atacamensis]|uniref:Uncharacterized protein n=2 Tax=Lentzea atacamensis TaxID=531938 RepID=A0ABX9E3U0_9PSEU|nr:hypothetical protein C8D87_108164 [Lentzea atacamensis]
MGAGDPGGNTVGDVHGGITQIGDVHGDVHIARSPARRWRRVAGGAVGALVVVVAATIVWRLVAQNASTRKSRSSGSGWS